MGGRPHLFHNLSLSSQLILLVLGDRHRKVRTTCLRLLRLSLSEPATSRSLVRRSTGSETVPGFKSKSSVRITGSGSELINRSTCFGKSKILTKSVDWTPEQTSPHTFLPHRLYFCHNEVKLQAMPYPPLSVPYRWVLYAGEYDVA